MSKMRSFNLILRYFFAHIHGVVTPQGIIRKKMPCLKLKFTHFTAHAVFCIGSRLVSAQNKLNFLLRCLKLKRKVCFPPPLPGQANVFVGGLPLLGKVTRFKELFLI